MSKPKSTKGQAVKLPPPAITRVVPAKAAATRAFAPEKQKVATTRAVTLNKQKDAATHSIAPSITPEKQKAPATHGVTPKVAGFFSGRLASPKEETTLPPPAAPSAKGSGAFSLFGTGPRKAASKPIVSRRP